MPCSRSSCAVLGALMAAAVASSAATPPARLRDGAPGARAAPRPARFDGFAAWQATQSAAAAALPAQRALGEATPSGGWRGAGAAVATGSAPPQALAPIVSGDGAIADFFGTSLAWDGSALYVGTPQDAVPSERLSGLDAGSVRIYRRVAGAWQRAGQLVPSEADNGFAYGQAIAQAGTLLLVGAPLATVDTEPERGVAYVYRTGGAVPALLARLVSPMPQPRERFGAAVATDGVRLLIGAPRRVSGGESEAGRVYVYEQVAGTWTAVATLDSPEPAAGDRFGAGVALDGDLAVIGAPSEEDTGTPADRGAAYVFRRASDGAWTLGPKLAPAALGAGAGFGATLLLAPDLLLVGASGDIVGDGPRGAAYVYARAGAAFTERQRLTASDGAPGDAFGAALARFGSELLIGAPVRSRAEGAAYLFAEGAGGYAERAILDPNDGGFSDIAGAAVALLPDEALLGAPLDDIGPNRAQGSVQVFRRGAGVWAEVDPIDTGDGAENERFGLALATAAGYVAVGSFLDEVTFNEDDQGTVTLFRRGVEGFEVDARLAAPDGAREDYLGFAVAMQGARLIAAAPRAVIDGNFDQGALYEFERTPAGWRFVTKLVAADGLFDDNFGFALAADAGRLLVGAPGYDAFDFDSGAAYLFGRDAAGRWTLSGFLAPPPGSQGYAAGITVALAGELALLGAPQARVGNRVAQGVVLVYKRTDAGWVLAQSLSAPDGATADLFGSSLALGADGRIAIGASGDDTGQVLDHGAVYLFEPGAFGSYGAPLKLVPEALAPRAGFGTAVLWREDALLVGASGADGSDGDAQQGRVFRFVRAAGGGWVAAGALEAPQGTAREFFGRSLAAAGELLVVGAPEKARDNPREGAAYVFTDGAFAFADGFE